MLILHIVYMQKVRRMCPKVNKKIKSRKETNKDRHEDLIPDRASGNEIT